MSTAAQIPPPPPGYTMDSAVPPPPPGYTLDSAKQPEKPGILDTAISDVKGLVSGIAKQMPSFSGSPLHYSPGLNTQAAEQGSLQQQQQIGAEDQARAKAGYSVPYRIAAPVAEQLGVNVPGMEQAARAGNPGAVAGHALAGAALAAAPLATEGALKGVGRASDVLDTTRSVRAAMPEETAGLPKPAIQGAEDVFRASAPVGTNTRFRANLYSGAGDLAEIGRDVRDRLAESKGGVIQPDMRTRVTVDAINAHLKEMYETERAPQIANHADAPVSLEINDDATAGLTQMSRAGEASVAKLAAKARGGTLTLAEADELARGVNAELRKYEAMTPEAQAAARVNTKALNGLKVLDRSLTEGIDDQLRIDGQPGIREYERRYAALSQIRDQLRVRANAAELNQGLKNSSALRGVRAAKTAVTGGPAGIASASQAAVADVPQGRLLQRGLERLADSGIKANRAVPRTPAPLELTPPPGRVPPAGQDQLNFNGADQEPEPKPPTPKSTVGAQRIQGTGGQPIVYGSSQDILSGLKKAGIRPGYEEPITPESLSAQRAKINEGYAKHGAGANYTKDDLAEFKRKHGIK